MATAPVYGQILSDATGLVNRFDVQSGGYTYEVEIVSNFDVTDFNFDENEEKLTLHIASGLENNLGEMIIPQDLLGGNFTFYLNDQEIFPMTKSNEKISFVTLTFTGIGNHTLDIFEINDLPETNDKEQNKSTITNPPAMEGGCLIATATYGSELSNQVQHLRELRDNSLLQTKSGTGFMILFNNFYYSFSPNIADYERENPIFREAVKLSITPMLYSLSLFNYVDLDTEYKVLGYGTGIILLNIGMYFVIPLIIFSRIHKIQKQKIN